MCDSIPFSRRKTRGNGMTCPPPVLVNRRPVRRRNSPRGDVLKLTAVLLLTCMYGSCHIYVVPQVNESSAEVETWLRDRIRVRVPAALGSISLRRTRCVRSGCYACKAGELHSSYVLSGRRGRSRYSLYIPDAIVSDVKRVLLNGRAIQDLLFEAAYRYAKARKRERSGAA